MLSRRAFLRAFLGSIAAGAAGVSYAVGIEPRFRLKVADYRLTVNAWTGLEPMRIAVLAEIHACRPWMPVERITEIVRRTNALRPDIVLLLGDFTAGMRRFRPGPVHAEEWGPVLGGLEAPLGVLSVLGNHDWWTDVGGIRDALVAANIRVLENQAVRLIHNGAPVWIAGLGDQLAIPLRGGGFRGVDDLGKTTAALRDDAPAILMVHEPDIFPDVPRRFAVTFAGHTHGGQINLPVLGRPVVPSRFGERYAYGHIEETGRQMVVSGGLGCSIAPVRFRVPPEITLVTLQAPQRGAKMV
ncbi:MAG TPA: metallophosphoesterase [Afifellaceae bacterium]|nr:metallophosphoesterase [Afifellaceae bacterium]